MNKNHIKNQKKCLIYNNGNSFRKIRKIEGYKKMSKDELLKALEE